MKHTIFIIIGIIVIFGLHLLIDRCSCNLNNGFRVGAPFLDTLMNVFGYDDAAAGGAAAGGAAGAETTKDKLMESYKGCNPIITDDILSQMKCMLDSGEIEQSLCNTDGGCGTSPNPLFKVIDKFYNKQETKTYKWSELNELLLDGNHYILICRIPNIHTYFLEFKNGNFRILSLWGGVHGFLDFPFNKDNTPHPWAYFDGHEDFVFFLQLLETINGNMDLDSPEEKWPGHKWTSIELTNSLDTVKRIFNVTERISRENYIDDAESLPTVTGKGDMKHPLVFRIYMK